jgi:putative glutamine amidotransferase
LRIGVSQRVQAFPDRDERRDCLDQAWAPWLEAIGMVAVPIPNRVADAGAFIEGLELSGVLLSGGNDLAGTPGAANTAPERDALERAILERSARTGLPVFGVCRGLQLLTVHYGGRLSPIADHVRERHLVTAEDVGDLDLCDREDVNSYHDWGVRSADIGDVLRIAALAPDGSVEALRHPSLPQAAIMWHPERAPADERDAALIRGFFERHR